MPSCTCKDWIRWQIPFKHFFAIFQEVPEWSWKSLPVKYVESAYLSTDNEALAQYFISKGVPQKELSFFSGGTVQPTGDSPDLSNEYPSTSSDHSDTHLGGSHEISEITSKRKVDAVHDFIVSRAY